MIIKCPRCGETSDFRLCNCMRRLRRYSDEARQKLRSGHPYKARGKLAELDKLLGELTDDAIAAREARR